MKPGLLIALLIVFVSAIVLVASGILIGTSINNSNDKVIENKSRLAYKVLKSCGKRWHMTNWAPLGSGEIIIDCAPDTVNGKYEFYSVKSIIVRR